MSVIMAFAQSDEIDASSSLLYRINTRFHLGDRIIEAIERVTRQDVVFVTNIFGCVFRSACLWMMQSLTI